MADEGALSGHLAEALEREIGENREKIEEI
jgi:hypothetical protein